MKNKIARVIVIIALLLLAAAGARAQDTEKTPEELLAEMQASWRSGESWALRGKYEFAHYDYKSMAETIVKIQSLYPQWHPALMEDHRKRIMVMLDAMESSDAWYEKKFHLWEATWAPEGPRGRLARLEFFSKTTGLDDLAKIKGVAMAVIRMACALAILLAAGYYKGKVFPARIRCRTFWPRFWALIADGVLFSPLEVSVFIIIYCLYPHHYTILLWTMIGFSSTHLTYLVGMHARYGQTLGKMIFKVKVVGAENGGAISVGQALVREIVWLSPVLLMAFSFVGVVELALQSGDPRAWRPAYFFISDVSSWVPLVCYPATVLVLFCSPRRRAIHDFAAGTVVVRLNVSGEAVDFPAPVRAVPAPSLAADAAPKGGGYDY